GRQQLHDRRHRDRRRRQHRVRGKRLPESRRSQGGGLRLGRGRQAGRWLVAGERGQEVYAAASGLTACAEAGPRCDGGGGLNRTAVRKSSAVRPTYLAWSFGSRLAPAGRQGDPQPVASSDARGTATKTRTGADG